MLLLFQVDDHSSFERNTPLHLAAACSDRDRAADVVRAICDHDDNINERNADRRTPLHMAAVAGNVDAVRTLLKAGADPVATDENWMTALHAAAGVCVDDDAAAKIVKLLCESSAAATTTAADKRAATRDGGQQRRSASATRSQR